MTMMLRAAARISTPDHCPINARTLSGVSRHDTAEIVAGTSARAYFVCQDRIINGFEETGTEHRVMPFSVIKFDCRFSPTMTKCTAATAPCELERPRRAGDLVQRSSILRPMWPNRRVAYRPDERSVHVSPHAADSGTHPPRQPRPRQDHSAADFFRQSDDPGVFVLKDAAVCLPAQAEVLRAN